MGREYKKTSIKIRLLYWVNKTDYCWLWKGYKNNSGYGILSINRIPKYVHRISWEIFVGPIPLDLHVLHKCDNPLCVNPEHLFLGTPYNNMQDCRDKERIKAKITLLEADNIRGEYERRSIIEPKLLVQGELAKRYRVSTRTIRYIVSEGRRLYGKS